MSGTVRRRRHDRNRQEFPGSGRRGRRLVRNCHILAAAVREVMEQQPLREAFPVPLSMPQFVSLKLLARHGARPMGELARLLGVTPPATTKIVDKLERLGLAARAVAPGDRRATLVRISVEGRQVVESYERAREEHLARVMARFSQAELAHLSELLEALSVCLLSGGDETKPCLRCTAEIEDDCPVSLSFSGCPVQLAPGTWCTSARPALGASGA